MKVLLIPSSYPDPACPVRGIFYKEQAQALIRNGIEAAVIHPELWSLRSLRRGNIDGLHGRLTSNLEDGVPTLRFRGFAVPRVNRRKQLIARSERLLKTYTEQYGRPDVVHAHCTLWAGCAAREIKRKYGIPYVVTEHSSRYAQEKLESSDAQDTVQTIADADEFIVVSRRLETLLQRYSGHRKLAIVPNLVNADFFTLPKTPDEEGVFRFLVLAALKTNKGVDLAIKAFAEAFRDRADVRLDIGGDGEERQRLERLADALSIRRQVSFLGMLSREEVRAAMWRANCLVLTSYFETFGVVLIEALATGIPVVATACGGPQDIVKGDVGVLVEPGSVSQLQDALLRSWQQRNPRLSAAAGSLREYAIEHFGEKSVVGRLDSIYRSVVQAS